MPTIKQMQKIDRSQLEPITATPAVLTSLPPLPSPQAPSPFMTSSLPPRAATLDQVTRQFYARQNLPQQRIFTPNIK